jgi:hypothetical protein
MLTGSGTPYVVNVACDFGQGKINTGIEFAQRPTDLSELVAVVEELYTAELKLQTGNEHAVFHCAVLLLLVDVVGDGSERKGRWVEVVRIEQISSGAQLFVFDSNSPPPSKGTIPKVQLVVTASQILRFRNTASTRTGRSPPLLEPSTGSIEPPSRNPLPYASDQTASGVNQSNAFATSVNAEAREYLFQQLCRASGMHDAVSASRLHAILAENGLVLSTEQFTEVARGELMLDRERWSVLEANFAPLIDALYVRLAAKAAHVNAESALQALKDKLQNLQDEEHRLLIRHANLREEMAKATRDVREEEQRVRGLETNEKFKDWSMVQKYISLKLRQDRLRKEEDQINKELSLL